MSISVWSQSTSFPTKTPAAPSLSIQAIVERGTAWGLNSSVDLQDCEPGLIYDANHIKRYVVELCERSSMECFGDCRSSGLVKAA